MCVFVLLSETCTSQRLGTSSDCWLVLTVMILDWQVPNTIMNTIQYPVFRLVMIFIMLRPTPDQSINTGGSNPPSYKQPRLPIL